MSHMPGVKPDLKGVWKNADRAEKTFLMQSVFLLFACTLTGAIVYKFGEIDTPEKVDLMLRSLFFAVMAGFGFFLFRIKLMQSESHENNQRVKKGLRYDWDAEDLDALEERVRKLEEEK